MMTGTPPSLLSTVSSRRAPNACVVKRGLCGLLRVTRGAFARREVVSVMMMTMIVFLFWRRAPTRGERRAPNACMVKRGLCGLLRVTRGAFARREVVSVMMMTMIVFLFWRRAPTRGERRAPNACMVKRGLCGLFRVTRGAFARREVVFAMMMTRMGFLFWRRAPTRVETEGA